METSYVQHKVGYTIYTKFLIRSSHGTCISTMDYSVTLSLDICVTRFFQEFVNFNPHCMGGGKTHPATQNLVKSARVRTMITMY